MIQLIEQYKKWKYTKKLSYCVIILLCLMAFYSFVTTPFSTDVKVFFAAANQVKYQPGTGLDAIQSSWEIKGLGNRILIYLLYSISDRIVGFENKIAFERVTYLIYGIIVILLLLYIIKILPIKNEEKFPAFLFLYASFFTNNICIPLQTEMTSILLSFLSFALILKGGKWRYITAGVLCASIFYIKSICVLLFPTVLISSMIFDENLKSDKKTLTTIITSFCIFLGISLILLYYKYPSEFVYMKQAASFEKTLVLNYSDVNIINLLTRFLDSFNHALIDIPVFFILLLVFPGAINYLKKKENKTDLILFVICWLLPLDIIFVSNKFFRYHYFLLVYPLLISFLLVSRKIKMDRYYDFIPPIFVVSSILVVLCWSFRDGLNQIGIINYSTLLLVQIHLILFYVIGTKMIQRKMVHIMGFVMILQMVFLWMNYTSFLSPFYRNLIRLEDAFFKINQEMNPADFGEEPVLYLDRGLGAFYFDAKSYRTYFYNMPISQWDEKTEPMLYLEEQQAVMEYRGRYIIVEEEYLNLNKHPEIMNKLHDEYEKIENNIFVKGQGDDVFELKEIPDSPYLDEKTYMLVRK